MDAPRGGAGRLDEHAERPPAVVWVDSREALVARWQADAPSVDRFVSEVPARHRSTGHLRHDPGVRHGGGGAPQGAFERHRREHLERFVDELAERLAGAGDLVLLGPGVVHEQLYRRLRELDLRHRERRAIVCQAAPRLTTRQIVARLRAAAGDAPRRRIVGSGRS